MKKNLVEQFIEKWKSPLRENASNQTGKLYTYALFNEMFERKMYYKM